MTTMLKQQALLKLLQSSHILLAIHLMLTHMPTHTTAAIQLTTPTTAAPAAASTLRFVHVIWRHGDRSPMLSLPNDVQNQEHSWPQGFGELTTKGVQQQFELGQWLRDRYDGFLSAQYKQNEIYIQCTQYNRTMMSALSVLAGLYPPTGTQRWSSTIPWQPIPVHTVPIPECPDEAEMSDEMQTLQEVIDIHDEFQDFTDFVSDKSGMSMKTINELGAVRDVLFCEEQHEADHPIMDWVNQTIWHKLENLTAIWYDLVAQMNEAIKLRGGLLLNEMLDRMQHRVDTPNWPLKLMAYSAHDTDIIKTLSILGAQHPVLIPPYSTTILLELHQVENNWIVQVHLRNSSTAPMYTLQIDGCPTQCPLNQLRSRFAPLLLKLPEFNFACGINSVAHQIQRIILLLGLGLLLLMALVIYIGLVLVYDRNLNHTTCRHMTRRRTDKNKQGNISEFEMTNIDGDPTTDESTEDEQEYSQTH